MMTKNNINLIYFLPILSIILSFLFHFFFEKIKLVINIYDNGNSDKRKIHLGNIAPIGGIIFYLIFIIYYLSNIFFNFENDIFTFKEQLVILITASFIFFIGLLDDKYSLTPLNKSILFILIILILILNNTQLQIYFLRFETIEKLITLGDFTIFFTLFCIFCFINAFNMYDGINLQSGFYLFVLFLVFSIKGIDSLFFISLLIPLTLFLYNNYKNRIFLGNSGTYFLSYLISIYLINSNIVFGKISVEEILILLLVPGLDMVRLFLTRIINGKSPFLPDKNHIHHLLLKKFNQFTVSLTIIMLTIIPYLIFILFLKSIIIVLLQVLLYFGLIYFSKIKIS